MRSPYQNVDTPTLYTIEIFKLLTKFLNYSSFYKFSCARTNVKTRLIFSIEANFKEYLKLKYISKLELRFMFLVNRYN